MNIGFIGGGRMAEAIVASLLDRQVVLREHLHIADISEERLSLLRDTYGVVTTADSRGVLDACDIVFLAVKPQNLQELSLAVGSAVRPAHLFISIAAGKRTAWLKDAFRGARVVRVMPNVAAFVGASMNVFTCGGDISDDEAQTVCRLLGSFGETLELPEALFDAVTAVSGSGPAFVAYVLRAMAAAGEAEGLAPDAALALAQQTMLGTVRLLKERNMSCEALIDAVSSPQGTTVAGMEVLRGSDVGEVMRDVIGAAAQRSRELSG